MVSVRIRTLTRQSNRLEAIEKHILPVLLREMDLHTNAVAEFLRIEHHKPGSKYVPTHRYRDSVQAVSARETKAELVANIIVDAIEDTPRAKNYTVYVGGDETGEGQQEGWVGDWPVIAESMRGGGDTGLPTWRQTVLKTIRELTR